MKYISAEFNPKNKRSVEKLQAAIALLEGDGIPAAEKKSRVLGKGTVKLLEKHATKPVNAEGLLAPKAIEAACFVPTRAAPRSPSSRTTTAPRWADRHQ